MSARQEEPARRDAVSEDAGLAAMLAQLQSELAALREENKEMKLKVGGELGADQDEELLEGYLALQLAYSARPPCLTTAPPLSPWTV